MIGIFTPIAFSDISRSLALVFTYLGIAFVGFGLILAIWRYIKNPVEKKLRIYGIITILDQIYKRLEKFVEEEKNTQIDLSKFSEISSKITRFTGANVPLVSNVEETKNAVSNFEKDLPDVFSAMFPDDVNRSQKIQWIHSVSRLLDRDGFGLKQKRRGNRKYSCLLKEVDQYYDNYKHVIDDNLRKLIRSYIDYAESAANALLFVQRMDTMLTSNFRQIPNLLTPSLEANIEGFSEGTREIARYIRVDIGQYIKDMDNP